MASLSYDGDIVNNAVEEISQVSNNFDSISSSVKLATAKIISAAGFDKYIGGINSDTFAEIVNECKTYCDSLVQTIRQSQIQILSYSQDDSDIQSFLNTLGRADFKELDLSSIDSHITVARRTGLIGKGLFATGVTFGLGLIEGVGNFLETGADLVDIGVTGVKTIFSGTYDLINGTNITRQMWNETKARVSEKKVESIFNGMYNNTSIGNKIKSNAYQFDMARGIGNGIGYSTSMIAANVVTGGLASGATIGSVGTVGAGQLAATAGVLGFSNGTEEAWADGATIKKGLTYGAASGGWEALQWGIGAKINQYGGFGDKVAKSVLGKTAQGGLSRVALDTVDSGLEGFVQPGLTMIYKDYGHGNLVDNYKKAFNVSGGWSNVASQAAIGGLMSTGSEVFDARKILKSSKRKTNITNLNEKNVSVESIVDSDYDIPTIIDSYVVEKSGADSVEIKDNNITDKKVVNESSIHSTDVLSGEGKSQLDKVVDTKADIPSKLETDSHKIEIVDEHLQNEHNIGANETVKKVETIDLEKVKKTVSSESSIKSDSVLDSKIVSTHSLENSESLDNKTSMRVDMSNADEQAKNIFISKKTELTREEIISNIESGKNVSFSDFKTLGKDVTPEVKAKYYISLYDNIGDKLPSDVCEKIKELKDVDFSTASKKVISKKLSPVDGPSNNLFTSTIKSSLSGYDKKFIPIVANINSKILDLYINGDTELADNILENINAYTNAFKRLNEFSTGIFESVVKTNDAVFSTANISSNLDKNIEIDLNDILDGKSVDLSKYNELFKTRNNSVAKDYLLNTPFMKKYGLIDSRFEFNFENEDLSSIFESIRKATSGKGNQKLLDFNKVDYKGDTDGNLLQAKRQFNNIFSDKYIKSLNNTDFVPVNSVEFEKATGMNIAKYYCDQLENNMNISDINLKVVEILDDYKLNRFKNFISENNINLENLNLSENNIVKISQMIDFSDSDLKYENNALIALARVNNQDIIDSDFICDFKNYSGNGADSINLNKILKDIVLSDSVDNAKVVADNYRKIFASNKMSKIKNTVFEQGSSFGLDENILDNITSKIYDSKSSTSSVGVSYISPQTIKEEIVTILSSENNLNDNVIASLKSDFSKMLGGDSSLYDTIDFNGKTYTEMFKSALDKRLEDVKNSYDNGTKNLEQLREEQKSVCSSIAKYTEVKESIIEHILMYDAASGQDGGCHYNSSLMYPYTFVSTMPNASVNDAFKVELNVIGNKKPISKTFWPENISVSSIFDIARDGKLLTNLDEASIRGNGNFVFTKKYGNATINVIVNQNGDYVTVFPMVK